MSFHKLYFTTLINIYNSGHNSLTPVIVSMMALHVAFTTDRQTDRQDTNFASLINLEDSRSFPVAGHRNEHRISVPLNA